MQRGARGSHPGAPARLGRRHRQGRELAVRRAPGRCPLASAGEKGGGTELAGARDPLVSERKEEKGRGWRAVLGYGDGLLNGFRGSHT
jgi:hypothetical protein